MFSTFKKPSMYDVKGRALGLLAVAAVILFIIFSATSNNQLISRVPNFGSSGLLPEGHKINGNKVQLKEEAEEQHLYVIVFDGGSTGSRVHVFHFKKSDGAGISLVGELYQYVKPGLSSYKDNPQKAAESLHSLIDSAMKEVPEVYHHSTPILLWATAGLRLIKEHKANAILSEVEKLFRKFNFLVPNEAVKIMDSDQEGIFSWVTVNFLEDRFTFNHSTVAALDLGGGSTQITFTPHLSETLSQKEYIKTKNILKRQQIVYTRSYLGYGLMSARYSILSGNSDKEKSVLSSPCLPEEFEGKWSHHGHKYIVRGIERKSTGYHDCLRKAQAIVETFIKPVQELTQKEIYVFSYFYDRALDARLISKNFSGILKVSDYEKAARQFFMKPDLEEPFLGLDLTYIYALLKFGYNLSRDQDLIVKKKIHDIELSWALGAAFDILSNVAR